MKTIFFLFFLLVLGEISCQSPEEKAANSFKAKVNQTDTLFSKEPVFLISNNFSLSSTGKVNFLIKIQKVKVGSFDIQKTNSLASPYTAYINLTIRVLSNQQFGNVKDSHSDGEYIWGFENANQAYEVKTFTSCTNSLSDNADDWCVGDIKILYAYQEGVWVFKGIETETENKIQNGTTRGDIEKGILNKFFQ